MPPPSRSIPEVAHQSQMPTLGDRDIQISEARRVHLALLVDQVAPPAEGRERGTNSLTPFFKILPSHSLSLYLSSLFFPCFSLSHCAFFPALSCFLSFLFFFFLLLLIPSCSSTLISFSFLSFSPPLQSLSLQFFSLIASSLFSFISLLLSFSCSLFLAFFLSSFLFAPHHLTRTQNHTHSGSMSSFMASYS